MKLLKTFAMLTVLAGFAMLPSVKADDWNKQTFVTLNTPTRIPGQVLAPGRYVFELVDNQSGNDVVRIFNADQNQLMATILGAPASRPHATGHAVITFEEPPAGSKTEAIGEWFFAGEQSGVEFVYPGSQQ